MGGGTTGPGPGPDSGADRERRWPRRASLAVAVAALVVLAGCGALGNPLSSSTSGEPHDVSFRNATAASGLDYQQRGTGIGADNAAVYALDADEDGWTDLLVMGGERPALYRNTGGAFERAPSFPRVDATLKSAAVVDYDGDGWEDVLLFRVQGAPVALHNDGGTFERDRVGIGNLSYPLGATAADYDRDGDRDLFVYQSRNWSQGQPAGYAALYRHVEDDNGNPNVLFENTGESGADRFERVTGAGIEGTRWSLAASFVDLTGDGYPDIHVANDYNNDTLYVNQGDGTFEQRLLGGATARNGMASAVADVTGDGRPDVFVTNIYLPLRQNKDQMSGERYTRIERLFEHVIHSGRTKGNTLLVNQGGGEFTDMADEYGVRHGGWGWSATMVDLNNDGERDVVHATQFVVRIDRDDPKWTLPMVWRGQADNRSFARVNGSEHGMGEHNTRGMTTLDYDRDGDRDVVLATYDGPMVLYENTVERGHSLQFEVVDGNGATALGATVNVSAGGQTWTVRGTDANGFFSQDSRYEHVGLDDAESATLAVTWPDGTDRTFEVEADRRLRVAPDGVTVVGNWSSPAG